MAIQTGKYKKRKEESKAVRSIADALERERGEEGTFQGIMQTVNPLISMATKWGGEKLLKGVGLTAAPWLAPFIYAYTAYQTKKGIEKLARSKGAGGESEEIVADNRFGFGKESAKTYGKGMKRTIEEYGPNIYADVASSYLSSVTPKFSKVEDKWVSGDLTKAYKDGFKFEDLKPFKLEEEGLIPGIKDWIGSGDDDLTVNNIRGRKNDYEKFLEQMGWSDWEERRENMEKGGQVPKYEHGGETFADKLTWDKFKDYNLKKGDWEHGGWRDRLGPGGVGQSSYDIDADRQVNILDLINLVSQMVSSDDPSRDPIYYDEAKENFELPKKYYGGGSVQGGSPTISEYFDMQGKTLGGSNQQSLAEMLRRK